MSAVQAQYDYPDGGSLVITVQVEDAYPDALDQARSEAIRGLCEAVAGLAPFEED